MSTVRSVREALAAARSRLCAQETASLDAEVLLANVLSVNRAWLYANGEQILSTRQEEAFRQLVNRRAEGEPVAYLLGRREFWSLSLQVTSDVLIPRPETELLVATALDLLQQNKAARVIDLGTGSGAIAIALAKERPSWNIHATDVSAAALEVARQNAADLVPGRIQFHQGSWLQVAQGFYDLIVSNPPYVDAHDPHLERGDCRFEPVNALTPGLDGLAAIEEIAMASRQHLAPQGWLLIEHGFEQGRAVRKLLSRFGYEAISTRKDLEGRERVSLARKAGE